MKAILSQILIMCLSAVCLVAQSRDAVAERIYLSTDKSTFVAGDRIWCSAFCFGQTGTGLSAYSSMAYVQLVDDHSTVQTAKIVLDGGRGSGYIDIPPILPTGNYRLVAYTAVNKNEKGYDYQTNSKVISIFNPYTSAKVEGNVEIISNDLYKESKLPEINSIGDVEIEVAQNFARKGPLPFRIINKSGDFVSISVSVFHEDEIIDPANPRITDVSTVKDTIEIDESSLPDFEGEVIYGKLKGDDLQKVLSQPEATAYISTPGSLLDTYISKFDKNGNIAFRTYNIYGNKNLVCEVGDIEDDNLSAVIELDSPFVALDGVSVPKMSLSENITSDVIRRGQAMRQFRRFALDSLNQYQARRERSPYLLKDAIVYKLDDYTRFPTVREVLVEIIQEARVRGRGGKQTIQVYSDNDADFNGRNWTPSLVLLDGVPIFKHSDMMDYDAMLLDGVEIWPNSYFFADKTFAGVVNFVSKSGNVAFMNFGSNVSIVDFQGACYPMEYSAKYLPANEEDIRQTIYWNPDVELVPSGSVSVECLLPDYTGKFKMVIEGVTSNGDTIYQSLIKEIQ